MTSTRFAAVFYSVFLLVTLGGFALGREHPELVGGIALLVCGGIAALGFIATTAFVILEEKVTARRKPSP